MRLARASPDPSQILRLSLQGCHPRPRMNIIINIQPLAPPAPPSPEPPRRHFPWKALAGVIAALAALVTAVAKLHFF